MGSLFLSRLTQEQRKDLILKLFKSQNEKCFICEKKIDLELHKNSIDLDHIVPITVGGKDDPSNLAVTHSSCNRSKQASNLEISRILNRFENIKYEVFHDNRGPNLNDVLKLYGGSKYTISFSMNNSKIRFSLPDIGINEIFEETIFQDDLSGFKYFFCKLPIEYIFHDDKINPRSIGQNISKLINEFYLKRPQLHISLGYIELDETSNSPVKIFDGQHKAASQVLLGVKKLPVRIFINPDKDILLTTNTNAGTTLRQVAFDKSVQRYLGSALYLERVERYQIEHNLSADNYDFSENDLVKYFKGEAREMKRYILDAVRDSITHNVENKLIEYVDFGGRGKEKPLSYSTIEKTFYSFFIYQSVLDTPIMYGLETGENPRELEKSQIMGIMNIIAEEIYIKKFDSNIGTYRIENRIQGGEELSLDHIKAYRMSKEEIIYNWLKYVGQIIKNYFIMQGKPINEAKLFQYRFPEPLWAVIRIFIRNLSNLPIWINKELSSTVFGGKQNYDFWQTIFETGKTPQGIQVLPGSINLMEMIKE